MTTAPSIRFPEVLSKWANGRTSGQRAPLSDRCLWAGCCRWPARCSRNLRCREGASVGHSAGRAQEHARAATMAISLLARCSRERSPMAPMLSWTAWSWALIPSMPVKVSFFCTSRSIIQSLVLFWMVRKSGSISSGPRPTHERVRKPRE